MSASTGWDGDTSRNERWSRLIRQFKGGDAVLPAFSGASWRSTYKATPMCKAWLGRTGLRSTGPGGPRRRPAPIAMPCSPASWSPLEHVGRRSRSFPPDQAGVGVVRLTTAGEGRLEGLVLVQSDGRRGDGNKSSIRQPK